MGLMSNKEIIRKGFLFSDWVKEREVVKVLDIRQEVRQGEKQDKVMAIIDRDGLLIKGQGLLNDYGINFLNTMLKVKRENKRIGEYLDRDFSIDNIKEGDLIALLLDLRGLGVEDIKSSKLYIGLDQAYKVSGISAIMRLDLGLKSGKEGKEVIEYIKKYNVKGHGIIDFSINRKNDKQNEKQDNQNKEQEESQANISLYILLGSNRILLKEKDYIKKRKDILDKFFLENLLSREIGYIVEGIIKNYYQLIYNYKYMRYYLSLMDKKNNKINTIKDIDMGLFIDLIREQEGKDLNNDVYSESKFLEEYISEGLSEISLIMEDVTYRFMNVAKVLLRLQGMILINVMDYVIGLNRGSYNVMIEKANKVRKEVLGVKNKGNKRKDVKKVVKSFLVEYAKEIKWFDLDYNIINDFILYSEDVIDSFILSLYNVLQDKELTILKKVNKEEGGLF